ncbi:MAG: hypothetical protein PHO48_03135 [Candidatus Gracilibacteria bacterium]|nr:hypothetical protein [Candidatus Gracilibacteria bacterium]MDD5179304.1 hypothetical protein [Candidatus Gracilibacteria bacterium]
MFLRNVIDSGAEHRVYETENPFVVAKIPQPWNLYSRKKAQQDESLCRMYFSDYCPDTEIPSLYREMRRIREETRGNLKYAILQTRVLNPKGITKQLMEEKTEIQVTMEKIAKKNRDMMKNSGASIEFLGLRNLGRCMLLHLLGNYLPEEDKENLTPATTNVVEGDIGNHHGVYLIDTSLLQTRGEFFAKIIAKIFYPIEKFYMRKFFGLEI